MSLLDKGYVSMRSPLPPDALHWLLERLKNGVFEIDVIQDGEEAVFTFTPKESWLGGQRRARVKLPRITQETTITTTNPTEAATVDGVESIKIANTERLLNIPGKLTALYKTADYFAGCPVYEWSTAFTDLDDARSVRFGDYLPAGFVILDARAAVVGTGYYFPVDCTIENYTFTTPDMVGDYAHIWDNITGCILTVRGYVPSRTADITIPE